MPAFRGLLHRRESGLDEPPPDHLRGELAVSETGNAFYYGFGAGTGRLAASSHLLFRSNGARIWHDIIGAASGATQFVGIGAGLTGVLAPGSRRCTVGGTANAITLTTGASLAALPDGLALRFGASAANTGATTIAVDGLAAASAVTVTGAALPSGYLRTDVDTLAEWNGSAWVVDRKPERGSGANGEWVRLADGTQTCQINGVTFARLTDDFLGYTWTFPVPFAAGSAPFRAVSFPTTAGNYTGLAPGDLGIVQLGAGVASALTRVARVASSPVFIAGDQVTGCSVFASGRWY